MLIQEITVHDHYTRETSTITVESARPIHSDIITGHPDGLECTPPREALFMGVFYSDVDEVLERWELRRLEVAA